MYITQLIGFVICLVDISAQFLLAAMLETCVSCIILCIISLRIYIIIGALFNVKYRYVSLDELLCAMVSRNVLVRKHLNIVYLVMHDERGIV